MNIIKRLTARFGLLGSLMLIGITVLVGLALITQLSGPSQGGSASGEESWAWIGFFFILVPAVVGIIYLLYSLIILGRAVAQHRDRSNWNKFAIICFITGFILLAWFGIAGGPNKGGVKVINQNNYIQAQVGAVLLLIGIICWKIPLLFNRK
jgi:quinol-cytochrome oxidoreductase complex cytochrome b subunit